MSTECPQCLSPRTRERHLGKQAGTAIGTVVGALSGAFTSTNGFRLISSTVLPIRGASLPGAIASAITGALSGSTAGAAVGQAFDAELLDSHLCLSCGNTFRPDRFERPMWDNR